MLKQETKRIKFKVVPRLLDHIGLAMYSKFEKAIGELIVNGYDADATKVEVKISIEEIVISDNGCGMDLADIEDAYMMLGSGHKRNASKTPKWKRLPIGNKGIGKLAGLGISKRMEITTFKGGKKYFYVIDRDKMSKVKTLDDAYHNLNIEKSYENITGTIITLKNLYRNIKIDEDTLRGHIAREIPQDKNFEVLVNGKKCLRKDIPAKRRIPVNINDKLCGRIVGEILISKKALITVEPGIYTTVRGRVVGPPSLFDLTKTTHRFFYTMSALITGMVEVSAFDPEEGEDEIPVIKTDREGFNEENPKYKTYRKIMTDLLIKICREEEKELEKKKTQEIEAKVHEAIKNIAEDINAFNKEKKQEMKTSQKAKAKVQPDGQDIYTETPEILKHAKDQPTEKRTNPVGITDKHLREDLKAEKGYGSINLGNRHYKITTKPLGEDDYECRIDDEVLIININVSHPAYDQAVAEKAVELVVFRAIAAAWTWKETQSSEEFYEKLDEMIRFQAMRMQSRRSQKRKRAPFLSVSE